VCPVGGSQLALSREKPDAEVMETVDSKRNVAADQCGILLAMWEDVQGRALKGHIDAIRAGQRAVFRTKRASCCFRCRVRRMEGKS
jgi:hypothetical protein